MNTDNKVLACVDQSHYADYVADYAAWAARRMDAPLEFLYIINRHPEIATSSVHSGAIGIDAQEALLTELSNQDESRSKAAREQGRVFLNRLRERAMAAGIAAPDVRQRHGALEETLVEQQEGVRLIVFGRRDESAETTQRDLGRNVERVVRAQDIDMLIMGAYAHSPLRSLLFGSKTSDVLRSAKIPTLLLR